MNKEQLKEQTKYKEKLQKTQTQSKTNKLQGTSLLGVFIKLDYCMHVADIMFLKKKTA